MAQASPNVTTPRAAAPPVAPPVTAIAPDCRHYRGDKPCLHNRLCAGCEHYAPQAHRVCVIKLGALGDVIRTLCILPAIRRQFPGAHVTWVSGPSGCRMISGHALIDRVLEFNPLTAMSLAHEAFDTVISLDKEPEPCALAMSLRAGRKLGVGLSAWGTPVPLNAEAEAYFHLGLSDELKFERNDKSYPALVHEALGLPYRGDRYELPRSADAEARVFLALATRGWRPERVTLGVNVGAGKVFANKMWPATRIIETIQAVCGQRRGIQVLLLGGPDERAILDEVHAATSASGDVFHPGCDFSEPEFVALVNACDTVFCGDTMAMHVAIALRKNVVAFFGPTCEQEIDLFGRGEKLVAKVPCGPCYKRKCDYANACVEHHAVADAAAAISRALEPRGAEGFSLPVVPERRAG